MSAAELVPSFQPGGAPISVLIDFDGTTSLEDVGDTLLERLYEDQDEVARQNGRYDAGSLGSRELMRWDMEVLPRDPEVLDAEIATMSLDPTLLDLVRAVRAVGGAIEVVSDGVGFHIEGMLARVGLDDLPVATNATVVGLGAEGMTFPYGHPRCFVCGTCKRERVRRHQEADRAVVFVGDGTSDRYAAHHADVVFAKDPLAAWMAETERDFEPWRRLADVASWIGSALSDGRLPANGEAFADWSRARPARRPRWICGPEIWGEGRSVAVTLG